MTAPPTIAAQVPPSPPCAPTGPAPLQPARRLAGRALPLALLALVAFAAGGVSRRPARARRAPGGAERFLRAWAVADYGGMYQLLSAGARDEISSRRFVRAYRAAAEIADATPRGPRAAGRPRRRPLRRPECGPSTQPLRHAERDGAAARWRPTGTIRPASPGTRRLTFPGLHLGEKLMRSVELPPRGALQTRDGQVIAEGEDRTSRPRRRSRPRSPGASVRSRPTGPRSTRSSAIRRTRPSASRGLERQFEQRLAGTLRRHAARRTAACSRAPSRKAGGAVRTSIDPDIEAAAVTALAGRYGGVAVLRPHTGEVLGAGRHRATPRRSRPGRRSRSSRWRALWTPAS